MKRDMEIVRELLINISKGIQKEKFRTKEEYEVYFYQLKIMKQVNLIDYDLRGTKDGNFFLNEPEITWYGNDYIDAFVDDTVWNKTKEVIKGKGLKVANVPFDIFLGLLKQEFKTKLGLE